MHSTSSEINHTTPTEMEMRRGKQINTPAQVNKHHTLYPYKGPKQWVGFSQEGSYQPRQTSQTVMGNL